MKIFLRPFATRSPDSQRRNDSTSARHDRGNEARHVLFPMNRERKCDTAETVTLSNLEEEKEKTRAAKCAETRGKDWSTRASRPAEL